MPRKKPKFRDDEIVACIESFVTSILSEGPFPVAVGDRLRGDHPVVRACGQFFAPDGTPKDEIHRLRAKLYADAEPPPLPPDPMRTRIEQRTADEDAVVNIH